MVYFNDPKDITGFLEPYINKKVFIKAGEEQYYCTVKALKGLFVKIEDRHGKTYWINALKIIYVEEVEKIEPKK